MQMIWNSKAMMKAKNKSGALTIPDFSTYLKVTVMKTKIFTKGHYF